MSGNIRIASIIRADLLYDNAGTQGRRSLYLAKEVGFETNIKEITYEGDGRELKSYQLTDLTAEMTLNALPLTTLNAMFGKTLVTTGLAVGETNRVYYGTDGDQAGIACGIQIFAQGINDTTNTNVFVSITAPVGTLSTITPPAVVSGDKGEPTLQFSAVKTSVDIAGDALPSVPSGGAFWYFSTWSAVPAAA